MCENSYDNFSESYRVSQVWLYTNVYSHIRSCSKSLLEFARNFSRLRHFSPRLVKKVPGDVKKGKGERGRNERDFSWIRGGVKRMRGANAFIRSVTITQVETRTRVPSLRQGSRERFFQANSLSFRTMKRHFFEHKASFLSQQFSH